MSLSGTDRGTGTHNTSALTFTAVPASNLTAGAMAVMCISADNSDTNGAAHSTFTVTDTNGNTWTRRASPLYDPGAASAGVEGGIFTTPQNGGTLTTGSTITVTFDANCTAKVWTLMEVVATTGTPMFVCQGVNAGAATAAPTVTTASLTSGDMVIGALFNEHGTAQTVTGDADTTNGSWSAQQTNEIGTTAAGQSVSSQRKVVTAAATQTYNPTLGVSSDCILAWIQIIEGGLSNLFSFSEQFDNAVWSKNFVTVTADSIGSPSGPLTADKTVESDSALHEFGVYRDTSALVTDNNVVTLSVYLKAATRTAAFLRFEAKNGTPFFAFINLTSGALGDIGGGAVASVADAGNGWWRLAITGNVSAGATTPYVSLFSSIATTGGPNNSYTGSSGDAIYLWGAQFERGGLSAYKAVPYQPFPYNPWLQRGPILAQ